VPNVSDISNCASGSTSTLTTQTEILRPNAAGDETNILNQTPSSGAHWDKVDEVTADDDSTYVASGVTDNTYRRDLCAIQDHSTGSGTINFVKVYVRCRIGATPTQASLKIAVKSGITIAESSEITVTTSYANYSQQWNTNPNTGAAWTWSEIDSLQAGLSIRRSTTSNGTRCTQVYVEVNYTP
jgi:hypothetical protein